ncbi:hypothetical protein PV08_03210 [Exophiala spinifera]|uniref:Uncharacterized protein n=1 Tax=Exophiala spinifera TaxID=91928 RepID=A0A0D1YUI8_9EURO|nr:uncharacterized protein PV08_03210 [Exophiala spinifera]KIW18921.1 hypothetical protein PV08_03210 [Exophiala spinifera]
MALGRFPALHKIFLREVQDGFQSGAFTSQDLVRAYVKRIEEVNNEVHAVIRIDPDAIETAKALDEERKTKGPRG